MTLQDNDTSHLSYDAVVVGGGIIGKSIAFELTRSGLKKGNFPIMPVMPRHDTIVALTSGVHFQSTINKGGFLSWSMNFTYGLRNWIEYGLKQSKNELGWADFLPPDYAQIQKWWEIVMSAYLLVSLHSQNLHNMEGKGINESTEPVVSKFPEHQWWDFGQGWKNFLNNLRLVLQSYQFLNLLKPWLRVFPITHLSIGFLILIALMNRMRGAIAESTESEYFLFSCA